MKRIDLSVSVGADAASALAEMIESAVTGHLPTMIENAVTSALDKAKAGHPEPTAKESPPTGVAVARLDREAARELRAAYLLGKLPDDGALLIDTKRVAELLNVSARTVFRLSQEKALPEPIRIGNKVQWRIREIIEWVEADCPPQKHWRYSDGQGTNTRKR